MKIISVVGARPNFMKIAPFIRAINEYNPKRGIRDPERVHHLLVHTGQHYHVRMSKTFFEALGIPQADINLEVGSGTHAEQVGHTMIAFEKVLEREKPDWVVVVGDVNATLACSVTAKKQHIKVCHIEAGLRSGDMTMPEEINRIVTDRLSDLLLTPDRLSIENLRAEGVPEERIRFVGNIMIDTLEDNREKAGKFEISDIIKNNLIDNQTLNHTFIQSFNHSTQDSRLETGNAPFTNRQLPTDTAQSPVRPHANPRSLPFALMTMHRPSNVDEAEVLGSIVDFLINDVTNKMPLIWPVHPRTVSRLKEFGLWEKVLGTEQLILLQPVGYHDMLRLNMEAKVMLTDSGGLQEECAVLGTPCLTLRENTERPVTLRNHGGPGVLVGNDAGRLRKAFLETLSLDRKPQKPELWDGQTAQRCVREIVSFKPSGQQ
ncbi:MAG: UDP-N-acetyl glucosamine 2-epimerase [Bacteroidales bacterium]|nr:UDP-N-acetyl glucosamine 2-epimerase [Bacteroidales bacterium]MCF8334363.1 UDP-N-acetyl glucosamine 2-epimerase [Bacteroidales bacterium]